LDSQFESIRDSGFDLRSDYKVKKFQKEKDVTSLHN
jgi:hypothetical protein